MEVCILRVKYILVGFTELITKEVDVFLLCLGHVLREERWVVQGCYSSEGLIRVYSFVSLLLDPGEYRFLGQPGGTTSGEYIQLTNYSICLVLISNASSGGYVSRSLKISLGPSQGCAESCFQLRGSRLTRDKGSEVRKKHIEVSGDETLFTGGSEAVRREQPD